MTKVIKNIELLKKIQPLLENEETDYYILKENGSVKTLDEYEQYLYGECDFTEIPVVGRTEGECKNCGERLKSFDNFKVKCKCSIWKNGFLGTTWEKNIYNEDDFYKTLTTDELYIIMGKDICHFNMPYPNSGELSGGTLIGDEIIDAKDLNEYFAKCLEYLIDNNLLLND